MTTADDGSFALQRCAPTLHVLIAGPGSGPARHHPVFRRKDVSPGSATIACVVGDDAFPSAVVGGRIVDEGGAKLVGIEAWVESGSRRYSTAKFDSGARFEFGPLPPGRIRVLARHPERGELFSTTFDLRPEQRLEVEDLRFACPGSLELLATDLDGAPMPQATFYLVHDQGYFASTLKLTDGRGRAEVLAPGRYFMHVFGNSVFDTRPIIVRPGETTHVRTRELPGHKRVFHFHYAGLELPINCRALFRDEAGEELRRTSLHLWQEKEFTSVDFHFAAGSYRLELELPDGRRIAQDFTVTGREGEPPVVVRLR
jgi:hypothetical protein